jgi:hypothetical protein
MTMMKKNALKILLILFVLSSCKNDISENNYIYNEQDLINELNFSDEYLSKSYVKDYNKNQIIWQTDVEDLDGDGQKEKIKVVVLDENYFKNSGIKGLFYGKVIINDISKDIYFNWSYHSHFNETFQIVDFDKNDNRKEFLISQFEQEDEDPSKIHYIYRFFGRNLLTQTYIKSDGYSGGNIRFHENDFEVTHKNNPQTIGTYKLSKFFIKKTNLYVGKESEIIAACPYVYLKTREAYIFKGEIIRNLIGKSAESIQTLELGTANSEKIIVRIKEEKEEISYLNQITVKSDNKIISPLILGNNSDLKFDDKKYYQLKKGEFIDLEFKVAKNSKITLIGKGYYIPLINSEKNSKHNYNNK